ncbi:unnamed protein product [Vitrella brassicaformis CCMP3155]|uniref:EF-hand domain-containing protein n=1 Tax=Vitrella brassicaformis (strain CCMP3155) TaxID=1169540 RepID=A0A0G4F7X8_VITBC|nr:unnamed protein product [Vitrella brassicaformis CCMP3155]|eukprot:CEM08094.1 unnamed protein product [Vitrella brassicaformis CCMP3155]
MQFIDYLEHKASLGAFPAAQDVNSEKRRIGQLFDRLPQSSAVSMVGVLRLGTGDVTKMVDGWFDAIDYNKNEFIALVLIILRREEQTEEERVRKNTQRLDKLLRALDVDGDGTVTAAELTGALEGITPPPTQDEIMELFREMTTSDAMAASYQQVTQWINTTTTMSATIRPTKGH